MSDDTPTEPREPGSPGVVGEQPNRTDDPDGAAPLDEHPDGATPHDTVSDHSEGPEGGSGS